VVDAPADFADQTFHAVKVTVKGYPCRNGQSNRPSGGRLILGDCTAAPAMIQSAAAFLNPDFTAMSRKRIVLNECIWVYGDAIYQGTRNARAEIDALKPRGATVFCLKGPDDADGLEQLRRRLRQSDAHVILTRLHPRELMAMKPILAERKNFSVVYDDWWIMPHWFTREAQYVVFRKYNGIAIRLGKGRWSNDTPPLLFNPFNSISKYSFVAVALRPPALVVSPFVNAVNHFRRQTENTDPGRYLYLPYAVVPDDLPLKRGVQFKYDFANTGGISGIWVMRDPFAPFEQTFATLYCDRLRLIRMIQRFEGKPFTFYHNQGKFNHWDAYVELTRQSRFVVSTGGLQDTLGPKFIEYACLGTPMIGRGVPFEAPWLDDCLFPLDIMRLTPAGLKPLLHEALERHAVLRDNCLNWRERLLKLHDPNTLLDMLQSQMDGQPVPPGYLKVDLKATPTQPK